MQLKESVRNTKKFFHITLQNIKSLFVGGYQKLSKSSSFKFSCGSTSTRNNRKHEFYGDFCNEWECNIEKVTKRKNSGPIMMKEAMKQEDDDDEEEEEEVEDLYSSGSNSVKLGKSPVRKKEVEEKEEKYKKSCYWRKGEEKSQKKKKKEDGYALARKMKELEMIDASDMEHVLDVEEALHYYSRLKSPVYLDIVDKFFTDMYSEFSVPRAPLSLNSSKRRLGSIRL